MKIPSAYSLLAIGLAATSPALAANCRPSKPASSASVVSSPSSVPSTPSTPPPVCGVQLVAGSNFYDPTLPYPLISSAWSPVDPSSVWATSDCPLPHTECGTFIVTDETSVSQTLDTAAVGQDYSFSLYYYIFSVQTTDLLICTATGTPAGSSVPMVTSMTVPFGTAAKGTWHSFNSFFKTVAEATTITVSFVQTIPGLMVGATYAFSTTYELLMGSGGSLCRLSGTDPSTGVYVSLPPITLSTNTATRNTVTSTGTFTALAATMHLGCVIDSSTVFSMEFSELSLSLQC